MKLPKFLIPAIIVFCAVLTIPLKGAFNYPAAQVTLSEGSGLDGESVREVEMIVKGVKCKGTANYFLSRYKELDGVLDLTAYAADHKVIIKYDGSKVDADKLKAIGEAPVQGRDGEYRKFFEVEKITQK